MQILADERRKAAKEAKTAAKRKAAPADVKAAGKKFYESMLVDSAYHGELFDDFTNWLNREKEPKA